MKIIINLLVSALSVFLAAFILPGVSVSGFLPALVAAVVLGVMNVFIKPIIGLLTLPITLLTFGLFALVINGVLVMVVGYLVDGFTVDGFLWAIVFAVVLSLVSWFLNLLSK